MVIGLIASSYSNRFLGPELKGELGQISSMISIVAVTANFGLYQPYPYYKRQGEPDVLDKFLRIFLLQFIAYTVIGVFGAVEASKGVVSDANIALAIVFLMFVIPAVVSLLLRILFEKKGWIKGEWMKLDV